MSYVNPGSILIGLVIPFVGVVGGIAVLSRSQAIILGFPAAYFWIFLWFLLTPLCLAASWYFFDRKYYEGLEDSEEAEEGES